MARYSNNWIDYELIDCTNGERLERWGKYILVRPDPQVIWNSGKNNNLWKKADAVYSRIGGGGEWKVKNVPESWNITYRDLTFKVKPMNFKHTGVFPEQAVNWDFMMNKIKESKRDDVKVLNLFAYTGCASVACAKANAFVCHVDASKGMVDKAKENAKLSNIPDDKIRYIVDDCKKFIEREIRRGNHYDGILMDPPSYGRGPGGEVWKLEDSIEEFIELSSKLISDNPLFFIVNSYTTNISPLSIQYIMEQKLPKGKIQSEEVALKVKDTNGLLPCGSTSIWTK